MAGFSNAAGDTNYLKQKLKKNVNAGEKWIGTEFEMSIEEYPDLTVLVRSTQLPAMGRSDVEDFGPMGLGFTQQGVLENKGEVACTAAETIKGDVVKAFRDIVKNKKMVTVNLKATPESTSGTGADSHKFRLEYSKIRSDAIDLSTEDTAAIVKPSFTIQYNWFDL